jgi:hypothetical protein
LTQSGIAHGKPDWWWGVQFEQRQTEDLRGVGRDLDDCKAKSKTPWVSVRARLSDAEIAAVARHLADLDRWAL